MSLGFGEVARNGGRHCAEQANCRSDPSRAACCVRLSQGGYCGYHGGGECLGDVKVMSTRPAMSVSVHCFLLCVTLSRLSHRRSIWRMQPSTRNGLSLRCETAIRRTTRSGCCAGTVVVKLAALCPRLQRALVSRSLQVFG